MEHAKAAVRAFVEHPFHIVKNTDVNFAYRFSGQLGLFVNARNLTNVAQDAQRYGPTSPSWSRTYRREEFGVQYTLGLKGTF